MSTLPSPHLHFPLVLSISRTQNFSQKRQCFGSGWGPLYLQTILAAIVPARCATNDPLSTAVAGTKAFLFYHSAKLDPLSIFSNAGIQVEPFSETSWMTSLKAVLFSILKVTFSLVLCTLSRVHAQEGSFGTQHRAGACGISAPWCPSFRCPLSVPGVTTHTPGIHSVGSTCYWNFYWFF